MKFSDIEPDTWDELKPYLDTCLLPVTGLTGYESPIEVTSNLEALRDIMDLVEIPFHGRIVTYPATHFIGEATLNKDLLNGVCTGLKQVGFKYIVLITAKVNIAQSIENVDLWVTPNPDGSIPSEQYVSQQILELWNV